MKDKRGILASNKRAQVTIFIIVAILLIAGVVIFFAIRSGLELISIPASIEPAYNSFLSCLEDKTLVGIELLESGGGYITSPPIGIVPLSFPAEGYAQLPTYEEGSKYMPFSSHLNFLGNQIPYWYYISGNNIERERVPTEQSMEEDLASYIEEKIYDCSFDSYYEQGFDIDMGQPVASVNILQTSVEVKLKMSMNILKEEDNAVIQNHQISVKSQLGNLYASAKTIYEKEQKELFLENYGIDTLRLYSPVDGVELTCAPKTWNADTIYTDLFQAIEMNTLALTTKSPLKVEDKYFYVDTGKDIDARFITSANWTNAFEVSPSEGVLLIANPVGNQAGLGVLGFCYVPYHFIYSVKYPVLVQVYSGDEAFQFPLAVIIENNQPRTSLNSNATTSSVKLCSYQNTLTTINVYDADLEPVDAIISYECLKQECAIGQTSSGTLTGYFPQCYNGYIIARANGYAESKTLYSTVQEGNAELVLNKLHELNINLKVGGSDYTGDAIIYFVSEGNSKVISYPSQTKINLSEEQYEISVSVYKKSAIQLQGITSQQCYDVPISGIGGILGATEQKCVDITIPSQMIDNALSGGGKQDYYISEGELQGADTIQINTEDFGVPKTIEEFQNNYLIIDEKGLDINIK